MVHAMYATLVMYYGQRRKAKEMLFVQETMVDAYEKRISNTDDTHAVLMKWGGLIKSKFDADNLHMTERHAHSNEDRVVACIQGIGGTIGSMQQQV